MNLNKKLEELSELEKKATKGPWIPCVASGGSECTGLHSDSKDGVICDFLPDYELKRESGKTIINDLSLVEELRNSAPLLIQSLRLAMEALGSFINYPCTSSSIRACDEELSCASCGARIALKQIEEIWDEMA